MPTTEVLLTAIASLIAALMVLSGLTLRQLRQMHLESRARFLDIASDLDLAAMAAAFDSGTPPADPGTA